jgi:BirA family biotin operon repressor/biotin-[acetyl-CoA-carboxylase] ligase
MTIRPTIIRPEETASTNSYLLDLLASQPLPEGAVVVTNRQTAGRGQLDGGGWESAPGLNITMSVLLRPPKMYARRQFILSQIASLAVKDTLDRYAGGISIKWPNDIYCNDNKICGMLIENTLAGEYVTASIVGIGLNVNQDSFPPMDARPISLSMITGSKHDLEEILQSLLGRLLCRYADATRPGAALAPVQTAYAAALYRREGMHPYRDKGGLFLASIEGVENDGYLKLRLESGETRRYAFKEVSCVWDE